MNRDSHGRFPELAPEAPPAVDKKRLRQRFRAETRDAILSAAEMALGEHAWRMLDQLDRGDLTGFNAELDAYAHVVRRQPRPWDSWNICRFSAMRALLQGQFDEAERLSDEALAASKRTLQGDAMLIYWTQMLALRVERQTKSALALAKVLEQHPKVESVHYPWLESHPSYQIATKQMRGGGAVVSFVVRGGRAAASRVVDAARVPQIAASLGGVESLIEQPGIMSFFELSDEELSKIGINPALIRLSVGIEETDDLIEDLTRALDQA